MTSFASVSQGVSQSTIPGQTLPEKLPPSLSHIQPLAQPKQPSLSPDKRI